MSARRCAECGRKVEREPIYLGRVVFGLRCARKLGLIQPRPRRWASPRPMDLPPAELLPNQAPLWSDEETGVTE